MPGQSSYAVKLVNGSNTVPFLGLAGRDVLLADEYWSDVLVNNASGLYINIQVQCQNKDGWEEEGEQRKTKAPKETDGQTERKPPRDIDGQSGTD